MSSTAAGLTSTLRDYAENQLRALTAACAFAPHDTCAAVDVLHIMTESWGDRRLHDTPRWSGVTDDCTPLEFSLGLTSGREPELRFVIEAQRDPATPRSYWEAADALNAVLARDHGACLERLERIEDLVRPSADVYFAMLHGAVLRPGRPPMFKVYLNPQAHGREHARAVTAEVFDRLGMTAAWQTILPIVRDDDELQFIALDLSAEPDARVKLYVRHRHALVSEFERAADVASNGIAADIATFVRELAPAGNGALSRPATTMFAATSLSPSIDAAFSVALYPFVGSDALAFARISSLLHRFALPVDTYERSVRGLTARPLETESGLHNYVSFQQRGGRRRVTIYLTPRMYLERLGPIGFDPVEAWPTPRGMLQPLVTAACPR